MEKIPEYVKNAMNLFFNQNSDLHVLTPEKFKDYRKSINFSQKKMGEAIGKTESTIFRYEKGIIKIKFSLANLKWKIHINTDTFKKVSIVSIKLPKYPENDEKK